MIDPRTFGKPWLMVSAVGLLVAGLIVDFAITQPRIQELHSLKQQQNEIRAEIDQMMKARRENSDLMQFMEDRGFTIEAPATDPAAFLGEKVEESKLTRLEMRATENSESSTMRRTQFFLRLLGKFGPTTEFVRSLEQGSRLIIVDAIKIEPQVGSTSLETRLNLSVYDPKGGN